MRIKETDETLGIHGQWSQVLTVLCALCLAFGGALSWTACRDAQRAPSLELLAGGLIVSGLVLLGAALRSGL